MLRDENKQNRTIFGKLICSFKVLKIPKPTKKYFNITFFFSNHDNFIVPYNFHIKIHHFN